MNHRVLALGLVLVALAAAPSCRLEFGGSDQPRGQAESDEVTATSAVGTPPAVVELPTPTPSPSPSPTPTTPPTPTPTPSPTPVPEPRAVTAAGCCGLFAWIDSSTLLVFDAPPDQPAGAWVVDTVQGGSHLLGPRFGLPGSSGNIAVPDRAEGMTRVVDAQGTVLGTITNGGAPTWLSPDGQRVAWLERLPVRTPSSSLSRQVRLWTASVDGSGARAVLDLGTSGIAWLGDGHRVIAAARATDGGSPGIWVIDVDAGTFRVLVDATFVQAVRVSPDGTRVAYLMTFTGDPDQDGLWVAEIDGPCRWRLPGWGPYRWGGDSRSLWRLELATDGAGSDHLVAVDVETGQELARVELRGRVLNDTWEVSPDGSRVAYWRESDRQVVVVDLPS